MINETITGNNVSTTTNPGNGVSDVIITKTKGEVILEVSVDGSVWVPVLTGSGSFSINTPDQNLTYRFRGVEVESANVYMGP